MFQGKKTCSKFSDQAIFRLHRVILKIARVNNLKALKTQSAWHKATLLVHFGSGDCYAGRQCLFMIISHIKHWDILTSLFMFKR